LVIDFYEVLGNSTYPIIRVIVYIFSVIFFNFGFQSFYWKAHLSR
jgi:hypothetical protein